MTMRAITADVVPWPAPSLRALQVLPLANDRCHITFLSVRCAACRSIDLIRGLFCFCSRETLTKTD
jgi:hypothetical protein